MFELMDGPIDAQVVTEQVRHPGAGAVLTFLGDARNTFEGRSVVRLEYEAYPEMAVPEMRRIAADLTARWPMARLAIVHRVGHVPVREASVVIAVSAPHRDAAYAASRFAIDELKARVPIWKKEVYADGSAWKQNQECNP